jgi:hypothetical protein
LQEASRKEILRGKALTDALILGWFYIVSTLLLHSFYFYAGWENLPASDSFSWKNFVIYPAIGFWLFATGAATYRVVVRFGTGSSDGPNFFISIWGPFVIGFVTTLIDILILVLYKADFL